MSRLLRALVTLSAVVAAFMDAHASGHAGVVTFNTLPVPGATITATRAGVSVTTTSREDGSYGFEELADGEWALSVEMTGFIAQVRIVSVGPTMPPLNWVLSMRSFDAINADTPMASSTAAKTRPPTDGDASRVRSIDPAAASPATPDGDGGTPIADAAFAAAESLLVNGSVNNGAASPFAQMSAFGNNRRGQRKLYNGGLGIVFGNSAWDARPFSFTSQPLSKPSYDDVQLLGTFGGPLRIPRLSRNGPTVFAGYQRTVDHAATTQSARMPTVRERGGDFSQSLDARGRPVVVTDPATGLPFADSRIPRGRLSPQAASLLQYYPEPNADGVGPNFQKTTLAVTHQDNLQLRASQTLGRRDSLFGNVLYSRTSTETTDIFGFADNGAASAADMAINWAHRFSQFLSLRLRYQHLGQANAVSPYFSYRTNVSGNAGIVGNDQDPASWGPPRLMFASGVAALGGAQYADNHAGTDTWSAESYRGIGRHNLTVGGGAARLRFAVFAQQDARGTFSFTGSATGSDISDFLLGTPSTIAIAFGNPDKRLRGATANAYVNDDWRVSPSLTLNMGVRWEYESPLSEQQGRLANLRVETDFRSIQTITGAEGGAAAVGLSPALLRPDWRGLQPRAGAAWRPLAGSSLVIRAGYGMYRNTGIYQSLALLLAQQPPFSKTFSTANTGARPLTLADGFVSPTGSVPNTFGIDPGVRVGVAHNWQASAQRDLPGSLTLLGSYLGTRGARLMQEFLPNTYPTGSVNPCPACPAGFVYLTSNGQSLRNAGQLQLRRRLRNGLMASVDYTLAKATDDASAFVPVGNPLQGGPSAGGSGSGGSTGVAGATIAQDWLNLDAERARSSFDQRHVLSVQLQYTTGMGVAGGALLDGLRARLWNGWTVTSQLTMGSGLPLTPLSLVPVAGTGITGTIRAALTGTSTEAPSGYYLNPAAYTTPAAGQWGSAGRNSISGPRQFSLNAGAGRTFLWGDRVNLDWRIDASNVLNRVTYSSVDSTIGSPQFGLPNRANTMRKVQTSIRVRF